MPELIFNHGKNFWLCKWTENGKPKEQKFPVTSVRTMYEARDFYDEIKKKVSKAA